LFSRNAYKMAKWGKKSCDESVFFTLAVVYAVFLIVDTTNSSPSPADDNDEFLAGNNHEGADVEVSPTGDVVDGDVDVTNGDVAQEQQQRPAARRPAWTTAFPVHQRDFIRVLRADVQSAGGIKAKTTAHTRLFRERATADDSGWVFRPPNPMHRPITRETDPLEFCVHPVGLWLPHLLCDGVNHMPCAFCSSSAAPHVNLETAQWPGPPRRVLGRAECWYLDTVTFRCDVTGRRFRATHPNVIVQLPIHARSMFHLYMGDRFAVDNSLASHIASHWTRLGSAPLARIANIDHRNRFINTAVRYFSRVVVQHDNDQPIVPAVNSMQLRRSPFAMPTMLRYPPRQPNLLKCRSHYYRGSLLRQIRCSIPPLPAVLLPRVGFTPISECNHHRQHQQRQRRRTPSSPTVLQLPRLRCAQNSIVCVGNAAEHAVGTAAAEMRTELAAQRRCANAGGH
jgi:hypothetical protein